MSSVAGFPPLHARAWFLTGPTASGKSGLAMRLAELLGAEILSLDSMALYRGLNIGTAKPNAADRARIPHHLLDLVEPSEEFSLARYLESAHLAANQLWARHKPVLLVGGTPLYLKALLRGLFQGPAADAALRQHLSDQAQKHGPAWLHTQLTQVDPRAAARLHPNDKRRIIRAIEVFERTGQPISTWQAQFDRARQKADCRVFCVERAVPELDARIEARVQAMWAEGLVDEIRALLANGVTFGKSASQAVGYCEVIDLLQGKCTQQEAQSRIALRTRQMAKRQRTWFRSLTECRSVPLDEGSCLQEAAQHIVKEGGPACDSPF